MPKVQFSIQTLIRVKIRGEKSKDPNRDDYGDDGLVKKFLHFLVERPDIRSPRKSGGMAGAGEYIGYFFPEHAEEIEKWLVEQGAKRTKKNLKM
ncbi:MAG: hypothetical protein NTY66_03810 [Candidatus Vogelbacteria bacterium]|nr:hypothetical protein [Candidatus Vogelbacteria bacterium]